MPMRIRSAFEWVCKFKLIVQVLIASKTEHNKRVEKLHTSRPEIKFLLCANSSINCGLHVNFMIDGWRRNFEKILEFGHLNEKESRVIVKRIAIACINHKTMRSSCQVKQKNSHSSWIHQSPQATMSKSTSEPQDEQESSRRHKNPTQPNQTWSRTAKFNFCHRSTSKTFKVLQLVVILSH